MINYLLEKRKILKYRTHKRYLESICDHGREFCTSPLYPSSIDGLLQFKATVRPNLRKCLKIGDYCNLAGSVFVNIKGKLTVGDYVFMNGVKLRIDHHMQIGNRCMFGPGATLWDTKNHPSSISARARQAEQIPRESFIDSYAAGGGDIIIEDDVWIGMGATILGPVRIGYGAVVAAHSVVTSDVPPKTLVAGIPARKIRSVPD